MKYIISLFFFLSLTSLNGCAGKNSQSLSAQDKNESIVIERFDKDLHEWLQNTPDGKPDMLISKYRDFLNAFGSVTVNNSNYEQADFFPSLRKYFSNELLAQIYKDALFTFSNVEGFEKDLTDANQLIGQYFPGKKLPTLSMHVSGLKANTIVLEDMISISIDRYLGAYYPQYQQFFEDYQLIQMQPEMVVRDYLKAWLMGELPASNKRKDLLGEMISQGKILYTLKKLLPDWDDKDIIGYTDEQLSWAADNEKNIWKTTLSNNYLYSTESMTIVKYMDEAPYTGTISTDSPGRLGAWLGWQIVKKYAENTNLSLEEIIKETDNQNILKLSKYNP